MEVEGGLRPSGVHSLGHALGVHFVTLQYSASTVHSGVVLASTAAYTLGRDRITLLIRVLFVYTAVEG